MAAVADDVGAAAAGDGKELRDSRFSHLLQPIRDLAANWDINIAGELEEYLEELESLTFAVEGCAGPALNFAEAALLIQGTTCVFSKKVEYLHNLVYQALETIFNRKQKEKQAASRQRASAQAGCGAADALAVDDFFDVTSAHLELLPPGDIDLVEEEDAGPPAVLRPPTALLALEDAACGQGTAQGEAGSYRLVQCGVHISGALLLETRDGELYDALLRPHGVRGVAHAAAVVAVAMPGLQSVLPTVQQQQHHAAVAGLLPDAGADADDAPGYADDEFELAGAAPLASDEQALCCLEVQPQPQDGSSYGLQALEDDAEALVDMPPAAGHEAAIPAGRDSSGQQQPATQGAAALRTRATQRGRAAGAPGARYFDPYEPLDPTAPGSLPLKPLQARKPRRRVMVREALPHGKAGVACLNSARHPGGGLNWPELGHLLEFITAAAAGGRRGRSGANNGGSAGGHLQAVAPQLAAIMDWQDAAAAAERDAQALQLPHDDDGAGGGYDNDGDAAGGGYDGPGCEDDWAPPLAAALEEAGEAGLRGWGANGAAPQHGDVPAWLAGSGHLHAIDGGYGDEDVPYEELCRQHMEALMAAAAAQQVQSELAVRVSGWRSRIDPILAEEEERCAFDIHDYGTTILTRLSSNNNNDDDDDDDAAANNETEGRTVKQQKHVPDEATAIDFKSIAAARNSFEVCRLFAATLQLVNNRNVNIIKQDDPDSGSTGTTCSALQLQLLSEARVHEAMAEGLAGGGSSSRGAVTDTTNKNQQGALPPARRSAAQEPSKARGRDNPGGSRRGGRTAQRGKASTTGKKTACAASSDEEEAEQQLPGSAGAAAAEQSDAEYDADAENRDLTEATVAAKPSRRAPAAKRPRRNAAALA